MTQNTNFAFPLAIEGTHGQLKQLAEKLIGLGCRCQIGGDLFKYNETHLVTNFFSVNGVFQTLVNATEGTRGRHLVSLSTHSEACILALAAARADGAYCNGEPVKYKNHIFFFQEDNGAYSFIFENPKSFSITVGYQEISRPTFEEIVNHFAAKEQTQPNSGLSEITVEEKPFLIESNPTGEDARTYYEAAKLTEATLQAEIGRLKKEMADMEESLKSYIQGHNDARNNAKTAEWKVSVLHEIINEQHQQISKFTKELSELKGPPCESLDSRKMLSAENNTQQKDGDILLQLAIEIGKLKADLNSLTFENENLKVNYEALQHVHKNTNEQAIKVIQENKSLSERVMVLENERDDTFDKLIRYVGAYDEAMSIIEGYRKLVNTLK
jgi:hypothetical protein